MGICRAAKGPEQGFPSVNPGDAGSSRLVTTVEPEGIPVRPFIELPGRLLWIGIYPAGVAAVYVDVDVEVVEVELVSVKVVVSAVTVEVEYSVATTSTVSVAVGPASSTVTTVVLVTVSVASRGVIVTVFWIVVVRRTVYVFLCVEVAVGTGRTLFVPSVVTQVFVV